MVGIVADQVPEFKIADTKIYVPVVTLSTHVNVKLLKQLGSGFKEQLIGISINLKKQINPRIDTYSF